MEREFGKFESGKELLRAYLELEKDYTRKCQKLAELLKKMEDVSVVAVVENAEILDENTEHSVKNAQNNDQKTENTEIEKYENKSGIIANKDACCNSTFCAKVPECDTTAVEKDDKEHNHGTGESDEKKPIYLSPMFGFWAKEFFAAS